MYSFDKKEESFTIPKGEYEVQLVNITLCTSRNNTPFINVEALVRDDVEENPKEWRGKRHSITIWEKEHTDAFGDKFYDYDQKLIKKLVNAIPRTNETIDFATIDDIVSYLRGAFMIMGISYSPSKDGTKTYTNYYFKPTKFTPKSLADNDISSSDDLDDSSLPF